MIVFDDNQFEIALVTYKRPEFVQKWLEKTYFAASIRNIKVSVYDSSPDVETKNVVNFFNTCNKVLIDYLHVKEDTIIGYKPMVPIFETKSEYLWVAGDSRCHEFEELDEKVFPYIKNRAIDYIVFNVDNNFELQDKIYEEKGEMIHDTFIASTCIGLSIYRVSIFDAIKNNEKLLIECDEAFKNNYGFGWLGYFYYAYAIGVNRTLLVNVKTFNVINRKKTQAWAVRFYGCWADDLCHIIDNIPPDYVGKDSIPRNTWKLMGLDSFHYSYVARKRGDLDREMVNHLIVDGIIDRITTNPRRIKLYATLPMFFMEFLYACYRVMKYISRTLKSN